MRKCRKLLYIIIMPWQESPRSALFLRL
jgi:hypothetical protein